MNHRRIFIAIALGTVFSMSAEGTYSLEQCRQLALQNNKQLMISRQKITKAGYQRKEAFAAYLPALDFNGGYMYNQKELSMFAEDQLLPVKSFNIQTGQYEYNLVTNPATGLPIQTADGQYVPSQVALMPKDALTYDIHNVFFGAITLTQPVYMGGKIVAMNQLTKYAEQLAEQMHNTEAENVIYAVDAAYWQVVSLRAKRDLAGSYVNLLDTLANDVRLMEKQGVATRADRLSVEVKLNSAQVDMTKVENGLTLSRMALAQVCGLPIDSDMQLADENIKEVVPTDLFAGADIQTAYQNRSDLKSLELGIKVAEQQQKVARSAMLPTLAVVGAYTFSNPNLYNGFSRSFAGAFSVGASLSIPLWHWGGNYYKYKSAESDAIVLKYKLEDAREKVALQVNQADFKVRESLKTFAATQKNLDSANENLRTATLGFAEGVVAENDVMAAQTAWLKANSENIDAMIDVYMCRTYLSKVLGTLR